MTNLSENNAKESHKLDRVLLIIVIVVVIFLMSILGANLYFQYMNYSEGIHLASNNDGRITIDHAVILSYSRAWDFAVIKTSALFLGFILVFIGALYILRTVEIAYSLSVSSNENIKMALSTTSPGLVLSSLGVIIIIFLLFSKSSVIYEAPETPRNIENEIQSVSAVPFDLTKDDEASKEN